MPADELVERHAVLERGVHALTVERHDRVCGVADEQHAVREAPWPAVHRAEQADGMARVVALERGQQRHGIGKLAARRTRGAVLASTLAKLGSPRAAGTTWP